MQFNTFKSNVQICIKIKGKIGETVTPKDSLTFAEFATLQNFVVLHCYTFHLRL